MLIIFLALATSAASITLTRSHVGAWIQKRLAVLSPPLGQLFDCPYCMSHWVAILLVCVYKPVVVQGWYAVDLIVAVLIIVGLSAVTTNLIMALNASSKRK